MNETNDQPDDRPPSPEGPRGRGAADTNDERVARAVEEYLAAVEAGRPPDRETFLGRFPDIAEPLSRCLDGLEIMNVVAAEVQQGAVGAPRPRGGTVSPAAPAALGDYRIVREIGRGGMGVVYEAEQLSLGRRVALKVLPFAAVLDPRQLGRFKTEAQAAAQLHHTNIVPVFAVGCERGVHYYAMQYIEGQSLAAVIRELRVLEGRLPQAPARALAEVTAIAGSLATGRWAQPTPAADQTEDVPPQGDASTPAAEESGPQDTKGAGPISQAARTLASQGSTRKREFFDAVAQLGIQAAEGLQHAHEIGIVHRDVKPSNLMLDARGNLWLTDFGLASFQKSEASLTMPGDVLGTIRYMSPEQARARELPVDHRTDIYSLGVTLYELLTLDHAFDGRTNQEILHKIAETEPRPPRRLNPAMPTDLETIVLKAMAKEPSDRYATAQELANDLRRFLEDKPVRARRPSVAQRLAKWARRHKAAVWSAVVAIAAIVITLAVSLVLVLTAWQDTESQRRSAVKHGRETEYEKGKVKRALALSQLDRGVRLLNEGDCSGLFDLLEARKTADGIPGLRESIARLWAIGYDPWVDRLVHVLPPENVLAFSPSGEVLATASGSAGRVWDAATGRPRHDKPLELGERVDAVRFSPDGKLLVIASVVGVARLWDTGTGKSVGPILKFGGGKRSEAPPRWRLAFSPDGKLLAIGGGDGAVGIWQTSTGKLHAPPLQHGGEVLAVSFSPDGKLLASGSTDAMVRLWVVETGQPSGRAMQQDKRVGKVVFSPDGKLLAVLSYWGTAALWNTQTCELHKRLPHGGGIMDLALSPDGKLLATASVDWTAQLWDTATGEPYGQRLRHPGRVHSVAFSPDSKLLVTASMYGTSRLWDTEKVEACSPLLPAWKPGDYSAVFSPDGKMIAVAASGRAPVRVWRTWPRLRTKALPGLSRAVHDLAFSPDGRLLAAASTSAVALWDAPTARRRGHRLLDERNTTRLAFSPDGKSLAVGVWKEGLVRLWDPATGRPADLQVGPQGSGRVGVNALAFSPDGKLLAAGCRDGYIRFWDVATGQPHGPPLRRSVESLAFSPDGRLLADGSTDHKSLVWDVATGRRLRGMHNRERCLAVAFSPDGARLAAASWDGKARLWDVGTGELSAQPLSHDERVWHVCYSPDGNLLATVSGDDRSVWLWDVAGDHPYHGLRVPAAAARGKVAFSPDGTILASGASDGTVRLWRLPAAPTDLREIQLRTWIALGARRDEHEQITPILRQEWLAFREELQTLLSKGGADTEWTKDFPGREEASLYQAALDHLRTGREHARQGRDPEAQESLGEALALYECLVGQYPSVSAYQSGLASTVGELTDVLRRQGSDARAGELLEKSIRAIQRGVLEMEKLAARHPGSLDHSLSLGQCYHELGHLMAKLGRPEEAKKAYRSAMTLYEKLVAEYPENDPHQRDLASRCQELRALLERPIGAVNPMSLQASFALDYSIRIRTPGLYRLYVRWDGHDYESDSLFVQILELADGRGGDIADWYVLEGNSDADFATCSWQETGGLEMGGGAYRPVPIAWHVSAPGEYTIRFLMREDGAAIDAFVFQLAKLRAPRGDGPEESSAAGDRIRIESGGRVTVEAEHFTARQTGGKGARWLIVPAEDRGDEPHRNYRGAGYVQALPDGSATLEEQWIRRFAQAMETAPDSAPACNSLAWFLATCPDHKFRDLARAVELARRAVELSPLNRQCWHTLGVAQYRARQYRAAVEALRKSDEMDGGSGFHTFCANAFAMAMAQWKLGDRDLARKWYDAGIRFLPGDHGQDTCHLRREAAALLELPPPQCGAPGEAKLDDPAVYGLLIELTPAAWKYFRRGALHGRIGQPRKARADMEEGIKLLSKIISSSPREASQLDPNVATLWYYWALARLSVRDLRGYRSACEAMLARFATSKDPGTAHWVAWTCILAPGAVADPAGAVQLAETAARSDPKSHSYLNTLGAALYRAGRFDQAMQRLREAHATWTKAETKPVQSSPAYTWFFLAMAHHRLGNAQEARKWLGKAVGWAQNVMQKKTIPGGSRLPWNRRLTLQILRREAEALIGPVDKPAPTTKDATPPNKE